ncbi:MAG: hypothetical protein OXU61_10735, partial [Gammaproteobacteria bacterium]|nr:hypothetical protein [Gammaproteobacteria bacterium]
MLAFAFARIKKQPLCQCSGAGEFGKFKALNYRGISASFLFPQTPLRHLKRPARFSTPNGRTAIYEGRIGTWEDRAVISIS